MEHVLTAIRLVLIGAGLSLLSMAVWVRRTESGSATRPFVRLLAVVGLLAVADGVVAPNIAGLSLVWALAYTLIPVAFVAFVVEYYGLPYLATAGQRLAFLAPVAAGIAGSAFVVFSPAMATASVMGGGAMAGSPTYPGFVYEAASLADSLAIFYAAGLVVAATGLLLRTCRRYAHLDTTLGVALSFVALWPWLCYLATAAVFDAVPTTAFLGATAGGYAISALSAGFVVSTGRLFEATPAAGTLGPETVLDDLADPVFVVDRQDRVVRLNDSAAETFDTSPEAAVTEPFAAVVGADVDEFAGGGCLELPAGGGTRHFEGAVAPVEDRHGRTPGRAVVVRDVTRRRLRGQRLTVLNRVLRHNLRNRMTSIIGRAELLTDADRDEDELAEGILTTADDLVTLGERAREVEQIMSVTPRAGEATRLATVVDSVVETVGAAFPAVAIRTDVDPTLTVPVDERILEPVLRNLVENAAEHNDAETPTVDVAADVDPDRPDAVAVTVADNGPGIPERERAVIRDGEESPLEHGSGLGLWAVYWGVTRTGGDLSFVAEEPGGARVVVRLPRGASEVATADPSAVAEAD